MIFWSGITVRELWSGCVPCFIRMRFFAAVVHIEKISNLPGKKMELMRKKEKCSLLFLSFSFEVPDAHHKPLNRSDMAKNTVDDKKPSEERKP